VYGKQQKAKKERFTSLMHQTVDLLWQAYHWLKRSAAPG
jgi:hypothetical protein